MASLPNTVGRLFVAASAILVLICPGASVALSADVADALTFEKHIRPIFRAHCYDCHGATNEFKGGLDLRLVRLIKKGGESGAAIVPGQPLESHLVERLRNGEMPPGETRVTPNELATIEQWIASGAKTARPEPDSIGQGLGVTVEERSFWSFQPVRRPDVPRVQTVDRIGNPIDAFLLAAATEGTSLAPEADRATLIKRAYLSLVGLPPTHEAMQGWLSSDDPDWFEQLVDRLLASPRYGERWSRHWLDVAGYADSEGYTEADTPREWAWKYRDWVTRSFNANMPIDQFVVAQLAGDELAGPIVGDVQAHQIDLLTATGFLRMAADGTGSGANEPADRNQVIADTLRIVSTSLLGLSLHCSQCHDHRFDPIPQTDYYAIRAVFEPAFDWKNWKAPRYRQVTLYTDADRERAAEVEVEAKKVEADMRAKEATYMAEALQAELAKYDEPLRSQLRDAYETPKNKRTDAHKALLFDYPKIANLTRGELYLYIMKWRQEREEWWKKIADVRARKPPEEFLRVLVESPGNQPATHLFHRGDHEQPKQTVTPAGLTVTSPQGERKQFTPDDKDRPTSGRRLAFARHLTQGNHPLVARVFVNRIWMHHFGRGLVSTPSDFGQLGQRPSHPALLDWLADEFVRSGWDLKVLHRLIMRSSAWRQMATDLVPASTTVPLSELRDPAKLRPIMRLDAETIRDRMMTVSGMLAPELYGPPSNVKEDIGGQILVDGEPRRRSLYVRVRRSQPLDMLQAFDAPVMETNCERRTISTVPTQSLMLMNSQFVLDQAQRLASRVAGEIEGRVDNFEGLPELPRAGAALWEYGTGRYDETMQKTVFRPLAHWTGEAWQGASKLPDPVLNWAMLTADGGHPGGGRDAAVIRRWTAPCDATITIGGTLKHPSPNGNGVRGRVVLSNSGPVAEWTVLNDSVATDIAAIEVTEGDTIDFITDANGSVSSDTFVWKVELTINSEGRPSTRAISAQQFGGPTTSRDQLFHQAIRAWELAYVRRPTEDEMRLVADYLARQVGHLRKNPLQLPKDVSVGQQAMTNLCQALISSNEFLYLD